MYNVTIDRNAMRQELLGPLFQRHVVSLAGMVDARWLDSFDEVARDSDAFQRYHLEANKGLVSFTCRASDGPGVVATFLERLALFVEMVNLHATCASTAPAVAEGASGLEL
ncbi:MAG TPA: hypothetical protein VKG23_10995 [Thermoanaerobaculia bacterium]|nr:hypothetical protein [Thermoanaerobaculia bacterium]